jgi:hypothetical protein
MDNTLDPRAISPISLQDKERVQKDRNIMNKGAEVSHGPINNTRTRSALPSRFSPINQGNADIET